MYQLSGGSLDQIMNGQNIENPVLQLLGYTKLRSAISNQYRLVVSDGVRMNQFVMLSTKLNHLIENGTFDIYAIFKASNYEVVPLDKKKNALIIMECEILNPAKEVQCTIGKPGKTNRSHPLTTFEVIQNAMQLNTSRDTNNFSREESIVPVKTLEGTVQPSTSRDTSNFSREESIVPVKILEGTVQPSTSRDTNNFSREESTVPVKLEGTMQPSTSRDTNNSSREEFTVSIKTLEGTVQPSISRDTNNSSREESIVPVKLESTVQPSTSRDRNDSSREEPIPIKMLSPQKRGAIQARVIKKSPIKKWKKQKSSGQWFDMHLADTSDKIRCVVYNNECDKFYNNLEDNKIYKISEYNLKYAKKEYNKLQNDYEIELINRTKIVECCDDGSIEPIRFLTFQEATEAGLGENPDSEDLFVVAAIIDTPCSVDIYEACPNCKKKMFELSPRKFKCEKCHKEYTDFIYGLRLNMNISDSTGGYRVTAFNEVAGSIFGMSVQAMGELKENDYNTYIKKIHEVELKKYTFVLKGRAQVYGGNTRPNYICDSITPLNHLNYSRYLMGEINKHLNQVNFN